MPLCLRNSWRKLVLYSPGDTTAKPFFHHVDHQVGDGIHAAYTVDVVALGDQVATFQVHGGVALAELFEVVPVRSGGLAVQQTGFCQQVTARPHAAETRTCDPPRSLTLAIWLAARRISMGSVMLVARAWGYSTAAAVCMAYLPHGQEIVQITTKSDLICMVNANRQPYTARRILQREDTGKWPGSAYR